MNNLHGKTQILNCVNLENKIEKSNQKIYLLLVYFYIFIELWIVSVLHPFIDRPDKTKRALCKFIC